MGSYRHLSREDREEIAVLRATGRSNAVIAATLGRAPSTISREVSPTPKPISIKPRRRHLSSSVRWLYCVPMAIPVIAGVALGL